MLPWMLLLWACKGSDPATDDPATTHGPVGTLPWSVATTTDTTDPPEPGAWIALDWSRDIADGGHAWVLIDAAHGGVDGSLDGVPLVAIPSPSYPSAWMFELPDDAAPGPASLVLTSHLTGETEALEVEVHAARFVDVADATGLADVHDTTGAEAGCAQALTGFAWADLDLDGDFDAIIGHYGATSRVLRNDGAPPGELPTFTDITASVGFDGVGEVGGLAIADIDGDGDPDLFVGRRGTNRMYRNELVETGRLGLTDITDSLGMASLPQRTMGAVFGDPDNDADVDFYEINHTWCFPGADPGREVDVADHFWRNDGDRYTELYFAVDDSVGARTHRHGFVGMFLDHERDGDLDLFVVNDFVPGSGPSNLFRNDDPANLVFTDISTVSNFGLHPDPQFKGLNGMGLSVADLNHDGFPDFAVSNIGPNILLMSEEIDGHRGYVNMSEAFGTIRPLTPWGSQSVTWATQMFDHDNDGDVELFYVGGNLRGDELVPHAFFDNQGDGTFADLTFAAGLGNPGHGKASALVDLDNDGFLDLAVANWGGPLEIYRNAAADRFPDHHWVMIELEGDGVNTHRDAMGSIVELETSDGYVQTCFRTPRPSLSGGGDPACHFGLGARDTITRLVVTWPDGHSESLPPPAVDQRVRYLDRRGD